MEGGVNRGFFERRFDDEQASFGSEDWCKNGRLVYYTEAKQETKDG